MNSYSSASQNETILSLIQSIHRSLKQEFRELRHDFLDLTFLQIQALSFIITQEQVKMQDLANELAITPAATTLLVDRLVTHRWLRRKSSTTDRRTVWVVPSLKAKKGMTRLKQRKNQALEAVLNKLTAQERENLHTLLAKIHSIMNDTAQKEG